MSASVYYNEIDPYCAQWLRNLMDADLIPCGDIDTRSIEDVIPNDLRGYAQCHFFAGLGGWPYALQLADWGTRPVWTGSCPCQPFSAAGKGAGFADERHLWPSWQHLISQCEPPVVFGEQVASATQWLGLVCGDMEAMGRAVGFNHIEAASAGAYHRRDRIFFVADTRGTGLAQRERERGVLREVVCESERENAANDGCIVGDSTGFSQRESHYQAHAITNSGEARCLFGSAGHWVIGHDGKARRVVSDLRGVVDGLSESLGGLCADYYAEEIKEVMAYAATTKQRPGEVLRALRHQVTTQAVWQNTGGFFGISEAQILLPYLCELDRRLDEIGLSSTVAQDAENGMRSMRLSTRAACASQEWRLLGQSAGEYPDTLHVLSQFLACAARQAFDTVSRNAPILRLLEDGIPARVAKLRALGNAIDPRPAAAFITAYMQARGLIADQQAVAA